MADLVIPATPQHFSFGGRLLYGYVTSYEGTGENRSATQTFLKRDGGKEEPMGRAQQRLDARLVFIGPDCAKQYEATRAFLDGNRTALLVHPIAGKYTAYCKGLNHRINFAESINKIEAPVSFVESELDATIPADTPTVATAAQNATDQQSTFQQTIAAFFGVMGKAQTTEAAALNAIDTGLTAVTGVVTAPIDFMASVVNGALGASSGIVGAIATIQASGDDLVQAVTDLIAIASDLFDGSSTSTAPPPNQVDLLLGNVTTTADTLVNDLQAAPSTPAGSADAVFDVLIMVDACMTLKDAIAIALPPVAVYVNPVTQSLIVLAQKLIADFGLSYDALTYASAILGYNRIPNPAAVPAGMSLLVPTA